MPPLVELLTETHMADIGSSAHEQAAAFLEAHPSYRILRALPAYDAYPLAQPRGTVRTVAVIDVETVGLDQDDPIIDLAIQRFAFDKRGLIVRVVAIVASATGIRAYGHWDSAKMERSRSCRPMKTAAIS